MFDRAAYEFHRLAAQLIAHDSSSPDPDRCRHQVVLLPGMIKGSHGQHHRYRRCEVCMWSDRYAIISFGSGT